MTVNPSRDVCRRTHVYCLCERARLWKISPPSVPPNFNDFTNTVAIVEFAFNYSFVCWIKAPRGQRSRAGSINVFVRAEATSCWRSPEVRDGAKLVSSPDLIRRVYRIQYNPNPSFPARDTESDPRWGWFWVWDRDYY